jgi:putative ABC transport system permease protein
MLANHLRSAKRILLKEKSYTIIHIAGLALGLATCFAIFSWVSYEASFDRSFDSSRSVYRVITYSSDDEQNGIASTYPMVRSRVLPQFPEVEETARLFNEGFLGSKTRITIDQKVFTDNRFYYGDENILKIFPLHMLHGDPAKALAEPNTVILTESTAKKFFGDADAVGKVLLVGEKSTFRVTGVISDIPENTHFHFDVLASMQSHPWIKKAEENVWSGVVFHTYVKLRDGASPAALEEKMRVFLDNFPDDPKQFGRAVSLRLQPLTSIHLQSNLKFELEPNGSMTYVYLFAGIGILVLALAIINYVNLATARHIQRFREVGVRKSLGASRTQLIVQFMTESSVITFFAIVVAVLLLLIAEPQLSTLLGSHIISKNVPVFRVLGAACMIAICTIFATGLFPAIALSNYKPLQLIKPAGLQSGRSFSPLTLRKGLLVLQFAASMTLTICTFVTYRQVNFLSDVSLGYDRDHIIVLNIDYPEISRKYDVLKADLIANASILGAAATSQLPSDIQTGENIDITKSNSLGVYCVSVDHDFFNVMGVHVDQGLSQIESLHESDSINHFVLNNSAVRAIGWQESDVLSKQISIRHGNMQPGAVIGTVDDFHFQSLHHGVSPLVIEFDPNTYRYLLVKVSQQHVEETLSFIAGRWNAIAGGIPFEYKFLDQEYDNLYKTDKKSSLMLMTFSALALFIAVLGIFGLTSFAVQRRTKEIGMRKILGAKVGGLVVVIAKDFIGLLIVSFLVAVPVGYFFIDSWLARFVMRTEVGVGLFAVAGILNLMLAVAAVSFHSLKIAATKPVDTLRQE